MAYNLKIQKEIIIVLKVDRQYLVASLHKGTEGKDSLGVFSQNFIDLRTSQKVINAFCQL
jgi:hypothetical protein